MLPLNFLEAHAPSPIAVAAFGTLPSSSSFSPSTATDTSTVSLYRGHERYFRRKVPLLISYSDPQKPPPRNGLGAGAPQAMEQHFFSPFCFVGAFVLFFFFLFFFFF